MSTTAQHDRLLSKLEVPAQTLMAIKKVRGAVWILSRNLNTRLADEEYGPDWLDRTEEEEQDVRRAARSSKKARGR